jgi:hypothetical protein
MHACNPAPTGIVVLQSIKGIQVAILLHPSHSCSSLLEFAHGFLLCPADALSSSSSEFGSSAKDAATGLKAKAKAAIKDATSAVPNTTATVGDLNADVRSDAYTYRDPAIATPQDNVTGKQTLMHMAGFCADIHVHGLELSRYCTVFSVAAWAWGCCVLHGMPQGCADFALHCMVLAG